MKINKIQWERENLQQLIIYVTKFLYDFMCFESCKMTYVSFDYLLNFVSYEFVMHHCFACTNLLNFMNVCIHPCVVWWVGQ